jgi:hypothetical protein
MTDDFARQVADPDRMPPVTAAPDRMTPGVRHAVIFLFVLNFLIGGAGLVWTSHVAMTGDQDRCGTLEKLIHLPVPADGTPARVFARDLESAYRSRARQLGCPLRAPRKDPP